MGIVRAVEWFGIESFRKALRLVWDRSSVVSIVALPVRRGQHLKCPPAWAQLIIRGLEMKLKGKSAAAVVHGWFGGRSYLIAYRNALLGMAAMERSSFLSGRSRRHAAIRDKGSLDKLYRGVGMRLAIERELEGDDSGTEWGGVRCELAKGDNGTGTAGKSEAGWMVTRGEEVYNI